MIVKSQSRRGTQSDEMKDVRYEREDGDAGKDDVSRIDAKSNAEERDEGTDCGESEERATAKALGDG